jgi:hypothetical protein
MSSKSSKLIKTTHKAKASDQQLPLSDIPETGELKLQPQAIGNSSEKSIRFPQELAAEQYKLPPDDFAKVQNAVKARQPYERQIQVFADSVESGIGRDSIARVLGELFGRQTAYFRSEEGGSLSLEEARKAAYSKNIYEEEVTHLLNELITKPADKIGFADLLALYGNNPATAENLWSKIKQEAKYDFESGNRAAKAFEPADYLKDAWNRASFLGIRESLCEEWKPKGGIELSMIDAIAQAWIQLQFWTEESVKRVKTKQREEDFAFQEWKKLKRDPNLKQWQKKGEWDAPDEMERNAIEQAAQMADRWQRMYFRAIRSLRDWRRYTPQVTINNPNQVNIATDGGQQVNVNNPADSE